MGLGKTLLIIAVSYYLIKFIFRLFSRMRGVNFNSGKQKNRSTTKSNSKKPNNKDDLGKYVDFEEVDD